METPGLRRGLPAAQPLLQPLDPRQPPRRGLCHGPPPRDGHGVRIRREGHGGDPQLVARPDGGLYQPLRKERRLQLFGRRLLLRKPRRTDPRRVGQPERQGPDGSPGPDHPGTPLPEIRHPDEEQDPRGRTPGLLAHRRLGTEFDRLAPQGRPVGRVRRGIRRMDGLGRRSGAQPRRLARRIRGTEHPFDRADDAQARKRGADAHAGAIPRGR